MTTDTFDGTLSWRNWLARHLRLNQDEKFQIYVNVGHSATLRDATYWAELLLSAGIATLGLALNSPAVIIGAMLISPLMGPIMAGGLALAAGDFFLGMRALVNIVLSSVAAIAFSTILVALLPFREMTAEIAARTHPNTLDLVIALFSGAVGALAVCKSLRGVATSIPGAAIAVALMPPLCVAGYGLGVLLTVDRIQGTAILAGGSLLFVTNLVAITSASMLVFLMLHIDSVEVRKKIREWRGTDDESAHFHRTVDRFVPDQFQRIGGLPARLLLVGALVAMVFTPLKRSFDALSAEIRYRQMLNRSQRVATETWENLFATTRGGGARSYIDRLDTMERDGVLAITVRAFISESITPDERDLYSRMIAKALGRRPDNIRLSVVEIPTSTYQVAKAKQEAPAVPAPIPESAGTRFQRAAQEILQQIAASRLPPGATMLDDTLAVGPGPPYVTITYLAPFTISEDARSLIAGDLGDKLDLPTLDVHLLHVPAKTRVLFDRRATTLNGAAAASLDAIAVAVQKRPNLRLRVETGSRASVAVRRAKVVRDELISRGIEESRIEMSASKDPADDQVTVFVEQVLVGPVQTST